MNYLLSDVASLSLSIFNAYQLLIVSFFFLSFSLNKCHCSSQCYSVFWLVALLLFFFKFFHGSVFCFTHFAQGFFWLMFFFYFRFSSFSRSPAPRLIFFGLPCSCQLLLGTMAASLSQPSARSGRTLFGLLGRGGCFSPRLCTRC